MSAKEATYQARKDYLSSCWAIALILAAVFVPVGFIPGIVCAYLYQQFAITSIAISPVILSAFIALIAGTPALCSLLLKPSNAYDSIPGGRDSFSIVSTTGLRS